MLETLSPEEPGWSAQFAAGSLILSALVGSGAAWLWIAGSWFSGRWQPVFQVRKPVRWPLLIVPAALLVWLLVPGLVAEVISPTLAVPDVLAGESTVETGPVLDLSERRLMALCVGQTVAQVAVLVVMLGGGRMAPRDLGLGRQAWSHEIAAGCRGFLASILPVAMVLLLTQSLRSEETIHPFLKLLADSPPSMTVAWIVLRAVILAPLIEELVFRSLIQGPLERYLPIPVAIIGSSLLFSAVHGLPDAIPLVPLGIVLGYVYHRRRSLVAVVVTHALFNAGNLAIVYLSTLH